MPVLLTETENENDSVNPNYVAKMTLQNDAAKMTLKYDVSVTMTSQTVLYFVQEFNIYKGTFYSSVICQNNVELGIRQNYIHFVTIEIYY